VSPCVPRFFVDVGSPYAYLAAERVERILPVAPTWEPVLLGGIFRVTGRSSWARTPARADGMREVERRAAAYGLAPIAWPQPWPGDMLAAMRAATAAAQQGAAREFVLAALRSAFRDGRDLGQRAAVRDAAGDAGLDADALDAAIDDPAVKLALRERTDAAVALGVIGVPAVVVGGEVFWGDDRLEDAAAATRAAAVVQ
jgi:2-hydroxychromene-2-carboxylate isomerase